MRRSLIAIVAALAFSVAVAPAGAATRFRPCAGNGDAVAFAANHRVGLGPGIECARVRVPLDRSGALPGRISLRVERVRAPRRRRGAVFAFAGGPGQAATPITEGFAEELAPALRTRDLVVFDQRGTGRSGLLRCRALERANLLNAGREAARCARTLGARRARYTTSDSVDDVEAVRRAIGVERIVLFGVSYGTKVALGYAARYPTHVERLVLDSIVDLDGPDPLYRDTFAAVPRALDSACARGGCRSITADPTADLARLVARLSAGPMRGYVVGADGQRRAARLGRVDLLTVLLAGDFDESLRAGVPGAVRSALRGDLAPILRLARRGQAVEGEPFPPSLLSSALLAATSCEEIAFPWQRTAARAERLRQLRAAVASLPATAFAPFDRSTALASDLVRLCASWPQSVSPPVLAVGPLPDVPALVLAGRQDLRTPLEGARRVAARFPRGRLVAVPGTGHDVLNSDLSSCAQRALRAFFSNRRVRTRCRRPPVAFAPDPVSPRSLADVRPAGGLGGRSGRTVSAALATFEDVLAQSLVAAEAEDGSVRGGGLRRGRFRLRVRGLERLEAIDVADERALERALERLSIELRMDRVVYVPGVRVSGTLRIAALDAISGRLRISGGPAAAGTLELRGEGRRIRLSGRLDGRRVAAEDSLEGTVTATAAAARDPLGALRSRAGPLASKRSRPPAAATRE